MEASNHLLWLPMQPEEVGTLEATLRKAGVCVPGNYRDSEGPRLAHYLWQGELHAIKFCALLDRNLLSPVLRLASGASIESDPAQERVTRLSCAVFAFCIWADILIEPSMALYEYASQKGNAAAQDELRLFRIADNTDPREFLDLALGRSSSLSRDTLRAVATVQCLAQKKENEPDFTKPLKMWKRNYLYVLKSLDLVRSGLTPVQAAKALMDWQVRSTFYNAAASMYCLAAMSHRPPKGKMLKGVGSRDVSTLRNGALNATWDICLLEHFGSKVTSPKAASWSFWSDDFAAKAIAKRLFVLGTDSASESLISFFEELWGRDGSALIQRCNDLASEAEIGSRQRNDHTHAAVRRLDEDIRSLEISLGIRES